MCIVNKKNIMRSNNIFILFLYNSRGVNKLLSFNCFHNKILLLLCIYRLVV